MKKLMMLAILSLGSLANAQEITGKLFNGDSSQVVEFAAVSALNPDSSAAATAMTGEDGRFRLSGLQPGTYHVKFQAAYEEAFTIVNVPVRTDQINDLGPIKFPKQSDTLTVVVITYEPKLIEKDHGMQTIGAPDLKHNASGQDLMGAIAGFNSDIKIAPNGKDAYVRGSRSGSVIYFVDGIKTTSMANVPAGAVSRLQVYTGGVPAKYGDTTGGVIMVETKSYFDLYRQAEAAVMLGE